MSRAISSYPLFEWTHKKILVLLVMSMWMCGPVAASRYKCPLSDFIRLGNSCYFLSSEIADWQEAHFRCRDRGSQLAVLASQHEDITLRSYLERPEFAQLGRWIGGMWAGKWIWAAQGTDIDSPRSFSASAAHNLTDEEEWMCLYMDPRSGYHWDSENCMRQLHYICEVPLAREANTTTSENDAAAATTTSAPSHNIDVPVPTSTSPASSTTQVESSAENQKDSHVAGSPTHNDPPT